MLAATACGGQPPTGPPPGPPPQAAQVDWAGLARLYDDPLYRRLPHLLDDGSVAESLDVAMSALVGGIRAQDLAMVRQSLATIQDVREAYGSRPGSDRHEQAQLIALSLFEIRGMAYIREVHLLTEDRQ